MAYRVVILASDGELISHDPETIQVGVDYVYVLSVYQGAAEFLASPCDALVVDFSSLEKKHLKLLSFAREEGVELFGMGVGGFPEGLSAADLSGMRLGSPAFIRENILTLARQKIAQAGLSDSNVRLTSGKYAPETNAHQNKELAPEYGRENS